MFYMKYDYIIIGAGISGIGAAVELTKNKKTFIILEKNTDIGGHVITRNINNCIIDIGFIFGNQDYKHMLEYIHKYNLNTKPHQITYTTIKDNKVNFSNETQNNKYNNEINRFYKISKKLKWTWHFISFETFCNKYNFDEDMRNDVFLPALSILFITNNAFQKSAYTVVSMLKNWVGLNPKNNPNLWITLEGNISIIQNIVNDYKIPIITNKEVINIKKYKKWIVKTSDNSIYETSKVITTCDPYTLNNIISFNCKIQKNIIRKALSETFITYGILHNDINYLNTKTKQLYYFRYNSNNNNNWILTGILNNQRNCKDNIYLSISNNKKELYSSIRKEFIIEEFDWYHQKHNTKTMLLNHFISPTYFAELNGIYFAGVWTCESIAHNSVYLTGVNAAKRSIRLNIYYILLIILVTILLLIILLFLIKSKKYKK